MAYSPKSELTGFRYRAVPAVVASSLAFCAVLAIDLPDNTPFPVSVQALCCRDIVSAGTVDIGGLGPTVAGAPATSFGHAGVGAPHSGHNQPTYERQRFLWHHETWSHSARTLSASRGLG